MDKNKLYTVNKWNRPMFGNRFEIGGGFGDWLRRVYNGYNWDDYDSNANRLSSTFENLYNTITSQPNRTIGGIFNETSSFPEGITQEYLNSLGIWDTPASSVSDEQWRQIGEHYNQMANDFEAKYPYIPFANRYDPGYYSQWNQDNTLPTQPEIVQNTANVDPEPFEALSIPSLATPSFNRTPMTPDNPLFQTMDLPLVNTPVNNPNPVSSEQTSISNVGQQQALPQFKSQTQNQTPWTIDNSVPWSTYQQPQQSQYNGPIDLSGSQPTSSVPVNNPVSTTPSSSKSSNDTITNAVGTILPEVNILGKAKTKNTWNSLALADKANNPWNYADDLDTVGQYMDSKNIFGISKIDNPFSKANIAGGWKSMANTSIGKAGLSVLSGVASTGAQKWISHGFNTGIGNAVGDIGRGVGSALSQVNPALGAAVSVGSGVLGGAWNHTFGMKTNENALNNYNNALASWNNYTSNANSYDQIQGPENFSFQNIYKGGWARGHDARQKNRNALANFNAAKDFAYRSMDNNIYNIGQNTIEDYMRGYGAALGGSLKAHGGTLGKLYDGEGDEPNTLDTVYGGRMKVEGQPVEFSVTAPYTQPYTYYSPWDRQWYGIGYGGAQVPVDNPGKYSLSLDDYMKLKQDRAKSDDVGGWHQLGDQVQDLGWALVTAPMFEGTEGASWLKGLTQKGRDAIKWDLNLAKGASRQRYLSRALANELDNIVTNGYGMRNTLAPVASVVRDWNDPRVAYSIPNPELDFKFTDSKSLHDLQSYFKNINRVGESYKGVGDNVINNVYKNDGVFNNFDLKIAKQSADKRFMFLEPGKLFDTQSILNMTDDEVKMYFGPEALSTKKKLDIATKAGNTEAAQKLEKQLRSFFPISKSDSDIATGLSRARRLYNIPEYRKRFKKFGTLGDTFIDDANWRLDNAVLQGKNDIVGQHGVYGGASAQIKPDGTGVISISNNSSSKAVQEFAQHEANHITHGLQNQPSFVAWHNEKYRPVPKRIAEGREATNNDLYLEEMDEIVERAKTAVEYADRTRLPGESLDDALTRIAESDIYDTSVPTDIRSHLSHFTKDSILNFWKNFVGGLVPVGVGSYALTQDNQKSLGGNLFPDGGNILQGEYSDDRQTLNWLAPTLKDVVVTAKPNYKKALEDVKSLWEKAMYDAVSKSDAQGFKSNGNYITLNTKGNMNLASIPTNLLDSIAINSGRSNTDIKTNLGLIGKEDTFGGISIPLLRKRYMLEEGMSKEDAEKAAIENVYPWYFPSNLTNNHAYGNNKYEELGMKASEALAFHKEGDLEYNETAKNAFKALQNNNFRDYTPHYHENILADAFARYAANPKGYNPGQGNYVPMVNNIANEVWNEPQIQRWWREEGRDWYNKGRNGYCLGGNLFNNGGGIHIDPSKKGTFTTAASKHGMGVQEFASKVLSNKEDYSPAMVKKANFARNASKWHGLGGNLYPYGGYTAASFMDDFSQDPIAAVMNYRQMKAGMMAQREAMEEERAREEQMQNLQKQLMEAQTNYQGLQSLYDSQATAIKNLQDMYVEQQSPIIPPIGPYALLLAPTKAVSSDRVDRVVTDNSGFTSTLPKNNKNWNYIKKKLKQSGKFTDVQIEGIGLNLMRESGFNPDAVGDGGKAYGLAQWHGSRQPKDRSLEGQVNYIIDTLSDYDGNLHWVGRPNYDSFMKARTPEEAHYYIAKGWERPAASITNNLRMKMNNSLKDAGYAFGGELGTNGTDWYNGLLQVNEGGSHEMNPLGGVPMGVDQQGTPNLVEEGETVYAFGGALGSKPNPYVFSRRKENEGGFNVPLDVLAQIGIKPTKKQLKEGISYAEASKVVAKESEERPMDDISQRGLEHGLGLLAQSQEQQRQERQAMEQMAMDAQRGYAALGGRLCATGGNLFTDGGPTYIADKRGDNLLGYDSDGNPIELNVVAPRRISTGWPIMRKDYYPIPFFDYFAGIPDRLKGEFSSRFKAAKEGLISIDDNNDLIINDYPTLMSKYPELREPIMDRKHRKANGLETRFFEDALKGETFSQSLSEGLKRHATGGPLGNPYANLFVDGSFMNNNQQTNTDVEPTEWEWLTTVMNTDSVKNSSFRDLYNNGIISLETYNYFANRGWGGRRISDLKNDAGEFNRAVTYFSGHKPTNQKTIGTQGSSTGGGSRGGYRRTTTPTTIGYNPVASWFENMNAGASAGTQETNVGGGMGKRVSLTDSVLSNADRNGLYNIQKRLEKGESVDWKVGNNEYVHLTPSDLSKVRKAFNSSKPQSSTGNQTSWLAPYGATTAGSKGLLGLTINRTNPSPGYLHDNLDGLTPSEVSQVSTATDRNRTNRGNTGNASVNAAPTNTESVNVVSEIPSNESALGDGRLHLPGVQFTPILYTNGNNVYDRYGLNFAGIPGVQPALGGTDLSENGTMAAFDGLAHYAGDFAENYNKIRNGTYKPDSQTAAGTTADVNTNEGTTPEKFKTWMRYAPVFGSGILTLTDLLGLTSKPDYTYANRLEAFANRAGYTPNISAPQIGDYMRYVPTDRQYLANMAMANARATDRNLMNVAGGNRSTAMAGLIGNGYNTTVGLGNIFRGAEDSNYNRYATALGFNRGTNQFNAQQALQAALANAQYRTSGIQLGLSGLAQAAQMRAAQDAMANQARSANITNLLQSLGNIGRENFALNQIASNRALDWYYGDTSGFAENKKKARKNNNG